ncbi:MAG: FKBP-type peptidyl-prolyl cis-trans isomerase [Phycisphaerales bacterium]
MFIREGVKLLEEQQGDGDVVQRQREYILSIRFTLNRGEVVASPPVSFRPAPGQRLHEDGFLEHRTRINRNWLIPGLFYAVQGMRIGGYRKVAISPHLAYGEKGLPDTIPPNAKLIAEIKVLREAVKSWRQRHETEIPEAERITQDELCQRYGITRPTLWHWHKQGQFPTPTMVDRTVCWRRSSIEQWEADGRPQARLSPDEIDKQREQAFVRLRQLVLGPSDSADQHPAELTPVEREELTKLMEEIDRSHEQLADRAVELALLMDEADQWTGAPIEMILNSDTPGSGFWECVEDALQKMPPTAE